MNYPFLHLYTTFYIEGLLAHSDVQTGLFGLVEHVAPLFLSKPVHYLAENIFQLFRRGFFAVHIFVSTVGKVEGGGVAMGGVRHGVAVHLHKAANVILGAQYRCHDYLVFAQLVFTE